jgi:hypothetical protein
MVYNIKKDIFNISLNLKKNSTKILIYNSKGIILIKN